MRLLILSTALTAAFTVAAFTVADAQAPKPAAPAAPAAAPAANKNAVVATVNGDPIRISDISAASASLPPEVKQQMPQEVIFQRLTEQLVARKALVIQARKEALDKDPAVQKQMAAAADQVLQSALLQKEVLPKITEEAIKAQYDKQYAGKPGEPEVHARHILVDTEAKAKDIIGQLKAGGKFEELAKKYGDPKDAATQQGGDLGFFKKADMLPEFADAAFKMKPKEYTQAPVHTRYGWHVIQTLETRVSQPPSYDQVHDELKQTVLQQNVAAAVAQAKSQVKIVTFGPDGTPQKPGGVPVIPAPAAAPTKK